MIASSPAPFPVTITADDLASSDAFLRPQALHAIAKTVWADLQAGRTMGRKSVLYPRQTDLWRNRQYAALRHALGHERLGWKLSALSAIGRDHAAVKIVGANALNRHLGLARSSSTILLLDKASMRPLCLLEGSSISAARTGTYASVVAETFFARDERFKVFLFGGGPIARWVCLLLAAIKGRNIDAVWIKTRSPGSAEDFATTLGDIGMAIIPVEDISALRSADLVITASNASSPLFSPADLGKDAIVLHLGGDETPARYLTGMLRCGALACDDVAMVSARGTSSLAHYFASRSTTLEIKAPVFGIKNLADLVTGTIEPSRPFHITCVGLPSLDLYVALHVYQTFLVHRPPLPRHGHNGQGQ